MTNKHNTSRRVRTQAQIVASRRNGMKSRGPKSTEGKAISSQNALKHGLRSCRLVLKTESRADYEALLASYRADWQPEGEVEDAVVVAMVNAKWRLERVMRVETALLDNPGAAADAVRLLKVYARAEAMFTRTYYRAIRTLLKMRKPRRRG